VKVRTTMEESTPVREAAIESLMAAANSLVTSEVVRPLSEKEPMMTSAASAEVGAAVGVTVGLHAQTMVCVGTAVGCAEGVEAL